MSEAIPFPRREYDLIVHWGNRLGVDLGPWLSILEEFFGNPFRLDDVADVWAGPVKQSILAASNILDDDAGRIESKWEGDASEAFKSYVTEVSNGLKAVDSAIDKIAEALRSLRNGIIAFDASIGFTLVSAAIAVSVGVAALGPSCGLSSLEIAGAVGGAVAAIGTAVGLFAAFVSAVEDSLDKLQDMDNDLGDLEKGQLPQPPAELGNPKEWEPTQGDG